MSKMGCFRIGRIRCLLYVAFILFLINILIVLKASRYLAVGKHNISSKGYTYLDDNLIGKVRVPSEMFQRLVRMSNSWNVKAEERFEPESILTKRDSGSERNDFPKWTGHQNDVPFCPSKPPVLGVKFKIPRAPLNISVIENKYLNVESGGHFKPKTCRANHRVAVIVPYRDRYQHLMIFLDYMHTFLQKQQLEYVIFIIEPIPKLKFNRAMLLNIGYVEAMKMYNFQCAIFHDIDLLPEKLTNIYNCPVRPRHLSVAVNTLNYKLPHERIFGGAVAMTKEQFEKVNGFSNKYFGWGGEDDDLYYRIIHNNMTVMRYSHKVARYTMLKHKPEPPSNSRWNLLHSGLSRWSTDGLNSLVYKKLKTTFHPLYTNILVSYPAPDTVPYPTTQQIKTTLT